MDESQPEPVEKLTASEISDTIPSSLEAEEHHDRVATAHPASASGRAEADPSSSDEPSVHPVWGLAIAVALLVTEASFVVLLGDFSIYWRLVPLLLLIASLPATAKALRKTDAQPSTAVRVYMLVVYAVCCAGITLSGLCLGMGGALGRVIGGWDPWWLWVPLGLLLVGFGLAGTVVFTIRIARLVIRLLRTRSSRRVP
jgi:hypothetical protein